MTQNQYITTKVTTTQSPTNIESGRDLNIMVGNANNSDNTGNSNNPSINIIGNSNIVVKNNLNTNQPLNITPLQNTTEITQTHIATKPNYAAYAVRGAADGAVAGWFAGESSEKYGIGDKTTVNKSNADVVGNNIGLSGQKGRIISTPIGLISGLGTSSLVDKTIGLNKTKISSYSSITSINVLPSISVGGNIDIVELRP